MQLMDKVLKHMSAGLIFMWTHKLLQADVLHMMDALGKILEHALPGSFHMCV